VIRLRVDDDAHEGSGFSSLPDPSAILNPLLVGTSLQVGVTWSPNAKRFRAERQTDHQQRFRKVDGDGGALAAINVTV